MFSEEAISEQPIGFSRQRMEGTFWAEKPKWEGLDRRLCVILEYDRSKVWDEDKEEGEKQIIESFLCNPKV